MREYHETRKWLGEDADASAPYIGQARTLLGVLKNRMALGGLQQLSQTTQLPDGTQVFVSSRYGQDSISISPVTTQAGKTSTPEPVIETVAFDEHDNPVEYYADTPQVRTGGTEVYSGKYYSNVLLGAVSDKTGKFAFIAYAFPYITMDMSVYATPVTNQSQLVMLDQKMQETKRFSIPMPDWGGQLTYDYATDAFYMNAFVPYDPQHVTYLADIGYVGGGPFQDTPRPVASRHLIRITSDGAQSMASDPIIMTGGAGYSDYYMWGNGNWWYGPTEVVVWPGGFAPYGGQDNTWSTIGSTPAKKTFPLSQPSVNGLIAVMVPGSVNISLVGEGYTNLTDQMGYAVLWSTVSQSIVWRGGSLGSYQPTTSGDDLSGLYNSVAVTTATGDAYVWVGGNCTAVAVGGGTKVGSPPSGTTDIAVTKKGDEAYAIIGNLSLSHYKNGGWKPVTLGGTGKPHAVLHDIVTDAIAVVMDDGSGAWIFNSTTLAGQPIPPYKFGFGHAPAKTADMIYPTQFINGTIFITYCLGWQGVSGVGLVGNLFPIVSSASGEQNYSQPYGMTALCYQEQTRQLAKAKWRAECGRAGPAGPDGSASGAGTWRYAYQAHSSGAVDAYTFVIGRYDIDRMKVS
jgi:hypothetical protein